MSMLIPNFEWKKGDHSKNCIRILVFSFIFRTTNLYYVSVSRVQNLSSLCYISQS